MWRVHLEPDGLAPDVERGPSPSDVDVATQLADAVHRAREVGATAVVFEAEPVDDELVAIVEGAGFAPTRTTLQLRRSLPLEATARGDAPSITTRAFRPGADDEAWLAVNNRAFAWHPDQAGQTLDDLRSRQAEPWFRADGFLVHESADGALDGFCWTKIHAEHAPPLGEIYVIGVDPPAHGRGLGRALVLAGLDWLSAQGLHDAMLYVESDNTAARSLYASMGFGEHQSHRWWRRSL
ncbi:MAG TPA: mycothiol synthase [Acidimicrobiales bacterium]|nr:mycothiol synthase [Acidimicrobiales bacterium]